MGLAVVSLVAIYCLTFLMVIHTPGNPFQSSDRSMSPEVMRALEARYDIDQPGRYFVQYAAGVLRGDLGPSFQYREWSVNQILSQALPVSLTIGGLALCLAVLIGIPLGVYGAVHRGTVLDVVIGLAAVIGISLPTFVTATILIGAFAVAMPLLPVSGWGRAAHLILPSCSLALPLIAYISRLMRVSMLDVLGTDYIRTARAKGLPEAEVLWTHAFPNAFLPVLTYLGPASAYALTGSFAIERIFNLPGLGTYFVQSVQNLDRGLIMGAVLTFSAIIIATNLVVDLLYGLVDPRIKAA
jgi:oligopeptide transport system permease protein